MSQPRSQSPWSPWSPLSPVGMGPSRRIHEEGGFCRVVYACVLRIMHFESLALCWYPRRRTVALFLLLCAGWARADGFGTCKPGDLTPECCIKTFPTALERCYGSLELVPKAYSLPMRATAVATATAMAATPVLNPAERRGVELATDTRQRLEATLKQCAEQADRQVNGWELNGRSPERALCERDKEGYPGTWAMYLGNRKHVAAWLCLREKLSSIIPRSQFVLEPRFMYNEDLKRWEYMDENFVSQIITRLGYQGLEGTLRPDLIILDAEGIIILVYDYKFPCPETNVGKWDNINKGRWEGSTQEELYEAATHVVPAIVTPRKGVIRRVNHEKALPQAPNLR